MNKQLKSNNGDNGKMIIPIDITDWNDEMLRNETVITSEEDVYTAMDSGVSMPAIARYLAVSRHCGHAPQDIMRPNKVIFHVGVMGEAVTIAKKRKRMVTTPSGKKYPTPEYVGPVRKKELPLSPVEDDEAAFLFEAERVVDDTTDDTIPVDDKAYYVKTGSLDGTARAHRYLTTTLLGHIRNKLVQILAGGGDVKGVAEELKQGIDGLVAEMV